MDKSAGPAPNNTNLAVKGINALGAWAMLLTYVRLTVALCVYLVNDLNTVLPSFV